MFIKSKNLDLQIVGKYIFETLTSKHMLSIPDKHHFPCEYYGLVIKHAISHCPNSNIKVGNTPPRLPCWQVILIFFVNRHYRVSHVQFKIFNFKKILQLLFMDGVQLSQGYKSHYKETVNFLPLSPHDFLVLIQLALEG